MAHESTTNIAIRPAQAKTISELASIIGEQTAKIERYRIEHGLPSPSLDAGPGLFPAPNFPPDIALARQILIDATEELQVRAYGPTPFLHRQLMNRSNELVSLHIITKFKIYEAIPLGKERSYEEIAQICGLNKDDVQHVLHHAIANHIFTSPRPGFVAHNGPSQVLAESAGVRALVFHSAENMIPSMSHLASALEKFSDSQDPTKTGFNLAYQTKVPFFEYLSQSKSKSDNFHQTMTFFSSGPAFQMNHVVDGFDWASLGPNAMVVDVGGSNGSASKALVNAFPNVTCIVQDRPEGLGNTDGDTNPNMSRVRFMSHDFFTEQPVREAEVYYLRAILHDWSNEYCIRIVQKLIPALGSNSKIIINDVCIPEIMPEASSVLRDWTCMNMAMKAMTNGQERSREEWEALITSADPQLKITSFTQPPEAWLSMIVCELQDSSERSV